MATRPIDDAAIRAVPTARRFDIPCTITVEQSSEHFHAHVELAGDVALEPGDKVRVHGDPITIPFGQSAVFERAATVTRAGPVTRALTRLAAYFDLKELYEVSFNPGRIK
ncbi:MAG: hypothetical protein ACOCYR_00750 [Erythrobacter sp.]|uniref:hypothetical protein n=1 Tax=Erythrobacter sp. HL-111 TaxID=1798193 RepID=UPI0006DB3A8F|nr:hypothetical protein [Erythrobacter sp. HL-111]KPP93883.1 MAG: hypothetical protein HLUCCO15_05650 [Erythrobacteraceae bacterium HL-111]SDS35655.1 hypothetical protein SAMN04515621_1418 [Erythrobacter sp. HL-111]